jgi:hypothetical protein
MSLVDRATAVTVIDDASYQDAAAGLSAVAGLRKSIEFAFADSKRKAFEAHKAITKLEGDLLAFPKRAELIIKDKIRVYTVEQERRRRIAEAEASAEAKRRQDEAAMAEAEELEKAGDHRGAAQVLQEAVTAPIPVIELPKPTAPGISTRKGWGYRVTDPSEHRRDYLILDEAKVGKIVRALGPDAEKVVGGIEVFDAPIVSVRT